MDQDQSIKVGDRVKISLNSDFWGGAGWFEGVVVSIEPYSAHRSFYWVRLDPDPQGILGHGAGLVSVLNPKNIQKL